MSQSPYTYQSGLWVLAKDALVALASPTSTPVTARIYDLLQTVLGFEVG